MASTTSKPRTKSTPVFHPAISKLPKAARIELARNRDKLTHKQLNFAGLLSGGETQTAALRASYASQTARHTATENASRLAKNSNVVATIERVKTAAILSSKEKASQIIDTIENSMLDLLRDGEDRIKPNAAKVLGSLVTVQAFAKAKPADDMEGADILAAIRKAAEEMREMGLFGVIDITPQPAEYDARGWDDYAAGLHLIDSMQDPTGL